MIRITLLFTFALLAIALSAQTTFHKTYGGTTDDYAYAVKGTSDGGYIVAGRTLSFGVAQYDAYLLRLNSNGDTLWVKTYGNTGYEEVFDVDTTSDGGYIIAGQTGSNGDFAGDLYLVKTDASGNMIWDMAYTGAGNFKDAAYSVQQTSDGGYVIAGSTESYGAGNADMYIIKTTSTGVLSWTRTIGTAGDDVARDIQQTSDGGYIVVGYTDGLGFTFIDYYLAKLDVSGNVTWTKSYAGNSYDVAYSIQVTSDNGYIIGGSSTNFGTGSFDATLLKTDAAGNVQWSKVYGGTADDRALDAKQTSDGGYIFCGRTESFGAGSKDMYVVKTDASGVAQWSKTYGGTGWEEAWEITEVGAGGYALCGMTLSFGEGLRDAIVIKTDGSGAVGCNELTPATVTNTASFTVASGGTTFSTGGVGSNPPTAVWNTSTVIGVQCASVGCAASAGFTPNSTAICVGGSITFTNSSSGAISYQWLEDGIQFSTATSPAHVFTAPGSILVELIATDGSCFDTTSVTIIVSSATASTDIITACDSHLWIDANTYTSSNNTATHTLTNAAGCDSVITLDLTITYSTTATDVITACDSYTWIDANTYTSSNNTATHTSTNAAGCDSVITLDLTINYSNTATDAITACDSYSWIDANTYTSSNNTATHTLTNAAGCDSVITLDLTINYSNTATDVITACDSYTWIDANAYASSNNTATHTLTNAAGCDSVITLDLTINLSTTSSITETAVATYTAPSGAIYTSSGIYSDTISNAAGCDSVITINLTINDTGLQEIESNVLSIYPNPASNYLVINGLEKLAGIREIRISTVAGSLVSRIEKSSNSIDVSALVKGVYFITVVHLDGIEVVRFVKK